MMYVSSQTASLEANFLYLAATLLKTDGETDYSKDAGRSIRMMMMRLSAKQLGTFLLFYRAA